MQPSKSREQLEKEVTSHEVTLHNKPDVDLEKLWDEAKTNFFAKTGVNLSDRIDQEKAEKGFQIQISAEVHRILEAGLAENAVTDREENRDIRKRDKFRSMLATAKRVFKGVFSVIWKFQEFLMPMASSIPFVGAGVTLLSKSIELLIETTKNYHEIFASVANLFEQVGFFSMRFDLVMEAQKAGATVHPKFVKFLSVILKHIVDCVALYVKLTQDAGKSKGFKEIAKVTKMFFETMGGDDQGVEEHLAKLRQLVEEESKLSSALVLSTVLQIHKNVLTVRENVDTIMHTMLEPSKIGKLKEWLQIDSEPWASRYRACADHRVRETGKWLLQHDLLMAWVAAENGSRVLALEAASSTGKTYLAIAAIDHLQTRAREDQTSAAVAYYLFDRTAILSTTGNVVRALLFQFCVQNAQFFKLAQPILEASKENSTKGEDLWENIVQEVMRRMPELTCYIVLDGLDLMDEKEIGGLRDVLQRSSQANSGMRFLLTGNSTWLSAVTEHTGITTTRLSLHQGYPNSGDIALVAKESLSRCDLFTRALESEDFQANVSERLVQMVSGDYYILSWYTSSMRRASSRSEVERVMNRNHQSRQDVVLHDLSRLAKRLPEKDSLQLRQTLHLLAVLHHLGVAMPRLATVQDFVARDEGPSTMVRSTIESAYSCLLTIDHRNYLAFAAVEVAKYLLVDPRKTLVAHALLQNGSHAQLRAIQHFLTATFTAEALDAHGFSKEFFDSKETQSSALSQFVVDWDTAMANTAVGLIESLGNLRKNANGHQTEQTAAISALARDLLPKILFRLRTVQLNDDVGVKLGKSLATLFLEGDMLSVFLPVEAQKQTNDSWGANEEYFEAVFKCMEAGLIEYKASAHALGSKWPNITCADDLKRITSQMIARRWLQSKSFWAREDFKHMFHWFTTTPELGLEYDHWQKGYIGYDGQNCTGWFTPPNWLKILSWVKAGNVQISDKADLDIHTAATLCAFGDKTSAPDALLSDHIKTDWRAAVLMAEATSWKAEVSLGKREAFDIAFALCNQSLKLMSDCKADAESVRRAIDDMLEWQWHWEDGFKEMLFRELAVRMTTSNNGDSLSYNMVSETSVTAVCRRGIDGGFDIFMSFYKSHRRLLVKTFVYQADKSCNSSIHIALSNTIANDADGLRLSILCEVYRDSLALCAATDELSEQKKTLTGLKLGFWLGRLNFLQSTHATLDEAIHVWENLVQDLLQSPATAEIVLMLPIVTHLCSAYVRKVLESPGAQDSMEIVGEVIRLVEVAKTSQNPLFLKLYFRTSLCLARIHMACGNNDKAHQVLQEHATHGFAMISQRNDMSLSNIGWLYLASILTVLGQEDAAWAWTKKGTQTSLKTRFSTKQLTAD
ncbi:neutral amino acid permease [Stemphylium lycopersici]|nr:neutral amino acid permease [Stemphylium lycopersici]